jgi:hypothetical protein
MKKPRKVFPVAVLTDKNNYVLMTMDVNQRQQSSMPEDEDDRRTLFPGPQDGLMPRPLNAQGSKEGP